jgi:sterol 3beta-glucosyltransferase
MDIKIPTIGSRGDVQPFIALALGLVRVGHQVDILTHPVMQNLVESHGLAFSPVSPDVNMNEVDPLFTS